MKKFNKILTFGLSLSLLAACGSNAASYSKNGKVSDGKDYIAKNESGDKTGTLQDLYDQNYDNDEVFYLVLAEMAKQELSLSYNNTTHTWTDNNADDGYDYAAIINERRLDYLNEASTEYTSTNATSGIVSIFDEELLVETLTANGYVIACANGYGPTLNADWTYDEENKYLCDYTNLYEKLVDNQILIDLLTERYILDESKSSITKAQVRKVNYLTIAKGNYSTVEGEDDEKTLNENNASSDFVHDTVLSGLKEGSTLESFEDLWRSFQTETIEYKVEDACSYDTDSSYTECSTYTDNSTISMDKGVKREVLSVLNTDYYYEEVLTNADTSVFNETINSYLFSTTTESRLKTIEGKSYLVSTALPAGQKVFSDEDIIITDSTNSKYIFLEVTIIDEDTADKNLLLEAARAVISDSDDLYEDALTFYLNKYKVEVHTSSFENYLEQNYPSVKFYR